MNAIVYPKLKEPVKGQKLDAAWGRDVVRAIKSITPISGKNIEIHRTQSGSIIRASGEGRRGSSGSIGGGVYVCRLLVGNALEGYSAILYESMAALKRDTEGTEGKHVTVYPCEIGLDSNLPEGTIVLVHEIEVAVTGGSENTNNAQES